MTGPGVGEGDGMPDPTDESLEDGAEFELPRWEKMNTEAPPSGWPLRPVQPPLPFESISRYRRPLAFKGKDDEAAFVTAKVSGDGRQTHPFIIEVSLNVTGSPSIELVVEAVTELVAGGGPLTPAPRGGLPGPPKVGSETPAPAPPRGGRAKAHRPARPCK